MQINNFYSDLVPSVRQPLDSIVLSPHTITQNSFNLTDMAEDSHDYQTLLPPVCCCRYHDEYARIQTKSFPRWLWIRCRHLTKVVRFRKR